MQSTVLILISLSLIALYINYNHKENLSVDNEIYNDKDSFLNDYVKKRLELQEKDVNEYENKKLEEDDNGNLNIVKEKPITNIFRSKTDNNNIYGIRKNNKNVIEENSKSNGLNYGILSGRYLNSNPFDGGTEVPVGPEIEVDVQPNYKYGVKRKNIHYNLFKDKGSSDGTVSLADVKDFDGKQTFKYMFMAKEQLRNAQENSHKHNVDTFSGQNDLIRDNNSIKINPNNTPDMHNYREPVELENNDITRRKESVEDPNIEGSVLSLKSMVNRRVLKDFS